MLVLAAAGQANSRGADMGVSSQSDTESALLILGREKLTWERKQSQRGRRGKFGEVRKQLLHWPSATSPSHGQWHERQQN